MIKNKVVLDACVFSKLFLIEPDRDQAIALIRALENRHHAIVVPQVFFYEVMATATYAKLDPDSILNLIGQYQKTHLQLIQPNLEVLKTAMAITDSGHPKSGYPSFYDAIYHALALCLNCSFITADQRHYEKTKHLGSIILLRDWENIVG